MVPIRMLIPHTYCSILLAAEPVETSSLVNAENLYQSEPICVPDTFAEAEKRYSDDMFFLRSIGVHLNKVFLRIITGDHKKSTTLRTVEDIRKHYGLTTRETQILERILQFDSNEEIAEEYDISSLTVQKHIQNLLRKLEVSSRLELFKEYHE